MKRNVIVLIALSFLLYGFGRPIPTALKNYERSSRLSEANELAYGTFDALSKNTYGIQIELKAKGDNKMVAATAKIEVTSVFKEKEKIPAKYTCQEQDISPPLQWRNVPEKTVSFALIMDDPDAPMGTWVHWVMWNIPASQTELKENVAKQSELSNGIKQGTNSGGKIGYMGPCPPSGVHRYYFKLYALDTKLQFEGKVTKETLLEAMEGHILCEGTLMGLYEKK